MKTSTLLFSFAGLTAVLTACGDSEAGSNEDTANSANENDVSGSVQIDGSGTVYPFMAYAAESFMTEENPNVSVEVSRAGTSAGMDRYVNGETDLSNASRSMTDEEKSQLEENGIESEEFQVALDGMTFVTHPENDWAEEMDDEDLLNAFISGATADGDDVQWSDIDPEWPDEEINFYGPNENHGTYEYFVETLIDEQDLVDGIDLQQDYSTLVELVSDDENALGFFGFGYYINNEDQLGVVEVDFGDGPVEPSLDTIAEDGDYADFTRPVFTNVRVDSVNENPAVKSFSSYIFDIAEEAAIETGFAPLPEEQLQDSKEKIEDME
ncbi:phosphate ABC transporter substrate-binding protein PstS family protein [Salisediminibacterium halotolerans]|uniref:Phosphate-binding protein n=1 Tax=Salisediminibacterium halotolerans TaxID=517425 RepID=A0A1H9U3V2_9BACI|nr:phosphate ABC transporter substrate-binding protein PstS family protein [Salisediminibacterium haloalkalitolerans]SES04240.1 phosphate transport system substrate-binding protein [Salisediminibacterium haloalkalitolerans]